MPIEIIAGIASTVVSSILFPYIKDGAEKMAQRITEKVGSSAAQHSVQLAGKVWAKVKSVFGSDDEKGALVQFEKKPELAKSLIESYLKEKLEKDEQLLKEFQALVQEKSPTGQTGAQIIGATYAGIVDLRGATISGSDAVISGLVVGSVERGHAGTNLPGPKTPDPQTPSTE